MHWQLQFDGPRASPASDLRADSTLVPLARYANTDSAGEYLATRPYGFICRFSRGIAALPGHRPCLGCTTFCRHRFRRNRRSYHRLAERLGARCQRPCCRAYRDRAWWHINPRLAAILARDADSGRHSDYRGHRSPRNPVIFFSFFGDQRYALSHWCHYHHQATAPRIGYSRRAELVSRWARRSAEKNAPWHSGDSTHWCRVIFSSSQAARHKVTLWRAFATIADRGACRHRPRGAFSRSFCALARPGVTICEGAGHRNTERSAGPPDNARLLSDRQRQSLGVCAHDRRGRKP
jgi:hypothetical protein